jgi:hypothetical protein
MTELMMWLAFMVPFLAVLTLAAWAADKLEKYLGL